MNTSSVSIDANDEKIGMGNTKIKLKQLNHSSSSIKTDIKTFL